MKKLLLQLVIGLMFFTTYAQFGAQQIISTNAPGASMVIPYDVNNDGFMDVLSNADYRFGWYQNLDGLGNFDNVQYLSETIAGLETFELHDLNSDGKLDIVYKTGASKIAWLENIDDQGTFGTEQIIAQGNNPIGYPYTIEIVDIDNDNDFDVIAILYFNPFREHMVWYENLDGLGNFSDEILITEDEFYDASLSIAPMDIDNDGDLDIVAAYYVGGSLLAWYENTDGNGNFAEAQEIYEFFLPSSNTQIINILPSDINGDGKMDILLDTYHEENYNYTLWIENIDAQGDFGLPQTIHINETTLGSLRSYDLDSDNDQDILISFFWGPNAKIAWHENLDGLGNFGPQIIISEEVIRATDATAADLNSDGKIDVISASQTDTKVAWYENLGELGVSDNTQNIFSIFPNPTNGIITITSNQNISTIEIYNVIGQKISEIKNQTGVNLSSFDAGIYFLKINDDSGNSETHKIIKE